MNSIPARRSWPIAGRACAQQKLQISCGKRDSRKCITLPAGFSPGRTVSIRACRRIERPHKKGCPLSCSICEKRKEKRFCPAVHGRICPQCCGEQREVTLDCPSECVYLQQARGHEKPRGINDVNPADIFLQVEVGDDFLYQQEHL